ncbi:MAG: hypothetical protein ABW006_13225 [Hyphomicrobium sp.]|jgi:DNA-binding MarR family transcriptional regulator
MSSGDGDEITEDQFLDAVSAVRFVAPDLSPIGAAILAAIDFGIAKDSRTFARRIGIEHALVLREVTALSSNELDLIEIVSRNQRTSRTEIAVTEKGRQLISRAAIRR